MQRVRGTDHIVAKLASGNGQPFSIFPIQHDALEIALKGSEEDIVQSSDAHEVTLLGRAKFELKCTVFALG
jgi:hypothetical protein